MFEVRRSVGLFAVAALLAVGCTRSARREETAATDQTERRPGAVQRGKASWYGARFQGRKTASGERFDKRDLTAAHKKLGFGTRVRVTNLTNGESVVVRINDRGPYGAGRIIDLSEAAARRVGMIDAGVVRVELEILSTPPARSRRRSR
jgi:rare lipoprotein A